MVPHLWFTVLPLHCSKTDRLAFGMGQEWDLLYPLLLKLKYLKRKGNYVVIDRLKIQSLHHVFIGERQLHYATSRRANEFQNHYFSHNEITSEISHHLIRATFATSSKSFDFIPSFFGKPPTSRVFYRILE